MASSMNCAQKPQANVQWNFKRLEALTGFCGNLWRLTLWPMVFDKSVIPPIRCLRLLRKHYYIFTKRTKINITLIRNKKIAEQHKKKIKSRF